MSSARHRIKWTLAEHRIVAEALKREDPSAHADMSDLARLLRAMSALPSSRWRSFESNSAAARVIAMVENTYAGYEKSNEILAAHYATIRKMPGVAPTQQQSTPPGSVDLTRTELIRLLPVLAAGTLVRIAD